MGPIMGGTSRIHYDASTVNIMFEGNSLVQGYGSTGGQTTPAQMSALPPLNGIPVTNFGVGGSTYKANNSMTARAGAVDAAYVPGKKNILFLWEGTNTIWNDDTLSGAAVAQQAGEYNLARKAAHPDLKIITLTTIPRYYTSGPYGADLVRANNVLIDYNNYLKAHQQELGIDLLIDTRASGIFVTSGTNYMPSSMAPYVIDYIHCNNAGYGLIAEMCAAGLRRLRAR